MEDAEEDLVLDSSPLARYLNEIGQPEFSSFSSGQNVSTSDPLNDDVNISNRMSNDMNSMTLEEHPTSRRFMPDFQSFLHWKYFTRTGERIFEVVNCARKCVKKLQESELWEDVDTADINHSPNTGAQKCTHLKAMKILLPLTALQLAFLIGIWLDAKSGTAFKLVLLFIDVVIFLNIVLVMIHQEYLYYKTYAYCKELSEAVNKHVSSSEMYCRLFDKSILLIREFEVVAMGLTYYHPNAPQMKEGLQKRGTCRILRRCILESTLKSFEMMQDIAKMLIQHLPEDVKLLYEENSVSSLSMTEIKSSLELNVLSNSDFIATDILKSLVCLNRMQQTEFLKISSLVMKRLANPEMNELQLFESECCLKMISKEFSNYVPALDLIIENVKSKMKFTRDYEFKSRVKKTKMTSTLKGDLANLMTRIDSASIHLKSSLDRLHCIEELLHGQWAPHEESDVISSLKKSHQNDLKDFIAVFSHNVDSAKSCMEDFEKRLFRQVGEIKPSQEPFDLNDSKEISQPMKFDLVDFKPEGDLLLEGVSEPVPAFEDSSRNDVCDAEKLKLKSELRESKRMIRELKAIFSLKKSPIGLLPFDLLKENLNANHSDECSEGSNVISDTCQEDVHEYGDNLPSSNVEKKIEEEEDDGRGFSEYSSDMLHNDNQSHDNSDSTFSNEFASTFMFPGLAAAIKSKQRGMHLEEQTLEADTYAISDGDSE